MKSILLFSNIFASVFANPTLLFLNDTTDHYHWGCTGTSLALKEEIAELGYLVEPVGIREMTKLQEVPATFDKFDDEHQFEHFKKNNPLFIDRLLRCDAVVINGEGSIHLDRPLPRALLYVAYVSKKFLHKHVEVINHSCFPEDTLTVHNEDIKKLYSEVYKVLDYVSVREPLSYSVMNSLGIEVDISFDSLPLYIQKHYRPRQKSRHENTVVLAGSAAWSKTGMATVVLELKELEKKGYRIQVLIGAKDHPALDDDLFVEFLHSELAQGWEIIDAKTMDEWLDTIANADLLVSGRFHHTIAAICLKTPFVIFNSNTPKIEGLLAIMPKPIEVLNYADPCLKDKLEKNIVQSLQMTREDFPKLDEICHSALKKFSGLKALQSVKSNN